METSSVPVLLKGVKALKRFASLNFRHSVLLRSFSVRAALVMALVRSFALNTHRTPSSTESCDDMDERFEVDNDGEVKEVDGDDDDAIDGKGEGGAVKPSSAVMAASLCDTSSALTLKTHISVRALVKRKFSPAPFLKLFMRVSSRPSGFHTALLIALGSFRKLMRKIVPFKKRFFPAPVICP